MMNRDEWSAIVSALPGDMEIKWLVLAAVTLVMLVYLYIDHRHTRRYHQRLANHATSHDTPALDYAMRLLAASARNKVLFAISFVLITASVVLYDIKDVARTLAQHQELTSVTVETVLPEETPAATETVVVIHDQAGGSITPAMQKKLDLLKRQYEQAMVQYFVLHACGRADVESLAFISGSIMLAMSETSMPAAFFLNLRDSAQGTYRELFASIPCEDPRIAQAEAEHQQWLKEIRNSMASQFKP